jgi:hypothetical protein
VLLIVRYCHFPMTGLCYSAAYPSVFVCYIIKFMDVFVVWYDPSHTGFYKFYNKQYISVFFILHCSFTNLGLQDKFLVNISLRHAVINIIRAMIHLCSLSVTPVSNLTLLIHDRQILEQDRALTWLPGNQIVTIGNHY